VCLRRFFRRAIWECVFGPARADEGFVEWVADWRREGVKNELTANMIVIPYVHERKRSIIDR
jgi:hypothetical protein